MDQETWDYYDTHPFNISGLDGNDYLRDSEKSWLIDQLESALGLDWTKDEDFSVPWTSSSGRSNTLMICSDEASASLRSVVSAIQVVLCKARNEFIIYLQTDVLVKPDYVVWVYRNRILVAPKDEASVADLLGR